MRVAMISFGYVGLVSGACFADFGDQVTCFDKDAAKIARLRDGDIPIFEPARFSYDAVHIPVLQTDASADP
jgi:UDPglucose 6-dehydrogenase